MASDIHTLQEDNEGHCSAAVELTCCSRLWSVIGTPSAGVVRLVGGDLIEDVDP